MRNLNYSTKQKNKIIDVIKKQKGEFTIKDIYNNIKDDVGLTTIYRLVDKLIKEGSLIKNISEDNITYYQYLAKCMEENHFYLKCDKCGKVIHIDCDCISDLSKHILNDHKFTLSKEHIFINGICNKCIKE